MCVSCVMTSNATCVTGSPATSNSVTLTVNPMVTASVAISASANPVCAGTSVTYTAVPANGGTTPIYQWKVNGNNAGTNSATFNYVPANNDLVTCELTSNAVCVSGSPATSNSIVMSVDPVLTASVLISPSVNPVCAGTSVTFTAVPTNEGTTPVYQWKVNGNNAGTNSATFNYVPANNDLVTCELTSNAVCVNGSPATSNSIVMSVDPVVTASVLISSSVNPVCAGTSVTFTAVPTNEGTTPVYQWKVNGNNAGTNSATFNYVPANNDLVTCELTSNAVCVNGSPATSNSIVMSVDPVVTASVLISPSVNPVCAGTSVTFTAVPTNEGTTPVYQWKVNGNNAGTNSATFNYIPANNDLVTCELTSNAVCVSGSPATSNSIVMSVDPVVTASVLISPSVNPVCAGTSVTFTAVPTNEGTTPVYQWKVNGNSAGTNSATFNYVPANNDLVTCELTSNAVCVSGSPATSNSIIMSVDPLLTVSVSINASSNPVLAGTEVSFTAIGVNQGSNPVYQWKVNGLAVGINATMYSYIPNDGDIILCELTSDALCATGNPAVSEPVVMGVDPLALSVDPPSQSVGPSAGTIQYTVTSNTAWTVESDQPWCLVSPAGSGNGLVTVNYDANTSGLSRSAVITVTVIGLPAVSVSLVQDAETTKQLNLSVLLEGLYNGTSLNKAQSTSGDQFAGTVADRIIVELHESVSPYSIVGVPYEVDIHTDGAAQVAIPLSLGSSYYLVIKHRNSLETWSANPVSFSGATISYDFSSSASQALGGNMKSVAGKFVLYSGDIDQDGQIDSDDMILMNTDAESFISGYVVSDLNGDGLIDADDMILLDNNAANTISVVRP
ncbi:MAG: hypothetical protein IPH45_11275 [Bacteroidales bacterium]|nr:hypothetical protein [Bacteroidales bacterium]